MSDSSVEKLLKIKVVLKDFFQLLDKEEKQQMPLKQFLFQLQQLGIQFNSEQKQFLVNKLCDQNSQVYYSKALESICLNDQGQWIFINPPETPQTQQRVQTKSECDRFSVAGSTRSTESRRSTNISSYSRNLPYENSAMSDNDSSLKNARLLIKQGIGPHDLYFIWGNFIKCDAQQKGEVSKEEFLKYLETVQVSWFTKKLKTESLDLLMQVCSREEKISIHKISSLLDAMHKYIRQQSFIKEKLPQKTSIQHVLSPSSHHELPEMIEFLRKLLINRIQLRFRHFKQAFAIFDQNKDGQISPDEFLKGIQWLNLDDQMNYSQIATLFAFLDKSRKGYLTYEQFSMLFCEEIKFKAQTSRDIFSLPKIDKEAAGLPNKQGNNTDEEKILMTQ